MRPADASQPLFQRHPVLLLVLVVCGLWFVAEGIAEASTPIEAGFRDFSFPNGTGDDEKPTAEKPESKLWFNDGLWWASLWNESGTAYHIHKLNTTTQEWIDTGTAIDDRLHSKGDALWDGQKLYFVSHIWDASPQSAPAGDRAELYRYSYKLSTKTYTLDAGFPVVVNQSKTEAVVLAKDTTGQLWITYVDENQQVMINHSVGGDDKVWATPFVLPVGTPANVNSDDLSSIIAFNGRVGVMWGHQNTPKVHYFSVHVDGDPADTWDDAVVAYGASTDDHINLKALEGDSAGRVFAAVKTSQSSDLIMLLVCQSTDTNCTESTDWDNYTVADSSFGATRPQLSIDTYNREIHVYYKTNDPAGGVDAREISVKTTSLDSPSFTKTTRGDPFIRSGITDEIINDVSTTKQNLNNTTDRVVIASSKNAPNSYFHNYVQVVPSAPVADFTVDVSSGVAPLNVNFTDISSGVPTSWSWDFGDTGTSTEQHPSHTYTSPGLYTVTLTATNAQGGDAIVKTDYINVLLPGSSVTFTPTDDARVNSTSPTTNYGNAVEIRTRAGEYESYLKFDVNGLPGSAASATLRLYVTDGSPDGGDVFLVSNAWTESTITYNTAPVISGTAIASMGAVTAGTWVEVDVTSAIAGNGVVSFGLRSASTNSALYSSKEMVTPSANPPELVILAASNGADDHGIGPSSGAEGATVIITGTNLTGATAVDFNGKRWRALRWTRHADHDGGALGCDDGLDQCDDAGGYGSECNGVHGAAGGADDHFDQSESGGEGATC